VNGSIEVLLEAVLKHKGIQLKRAVTDYISLFGKNIIRLIDGNIRMEASSAKELAPNDWTAQQLLLNSGGTTSRFTAIAGSVSAFLKLASLYAQEPVDAPGEMMESIVRTFCRKRIYC
jgi:hypothetical protein